MARSAELEMVRFKQRDIGHATSRLIYNFAEYSNITGTNTWQRLEAEILQLIRDHRSLDVMWEAEGLDINFSYFLDPIPEIRGEDLVLISPEPRVTFFEQRETLLPSQRTHVSKIAEAIAFEMEDVYHLRVEKTP